MQFFAYKNLLKRYLLHLKCAVLLLWFSWVRYQCATLLLRVVMQYLMNCRKIKIRKHIFSPDCNSERRIILYASKIMIEKSYACRRGASQTTGRQPGRHDTADRAIRSLRYTSIELDSDKRTRCHLYDCWECRPDGRNDVLHNENKQTIAMSNNIQSGTAKTKL